MDGDGTGEFYRLEEGAMKKMAGLRGYSSHPFGSRNLDMSVAGDFEGDGTFELLVTDVSLERLVAVIRTRGAFDCSFH